MWEHLFAFLTTLYLGWILGVIKGWDDRAHLFILLGLSALAAIILVQSGPEEAASLVDISRFAAYGLGWIVGTPFGELSYDKAVGGDHGIPV